MNQTTSALNDDSDLSSGDPTGSSFPAGLAPNEPAPAKPQVPPIDVLHVINGEHYSGAERVQDLLAKGLPAHHFQVTFACVKPGKFPEARDYTDAPLLELPMRSRLDRRAVRQLVSKIREEKFRLLHAHTPRSLWIAAAAARKTGLPLVYHVHSPTGRDSTRWLQNRINAALESWSLRRAVKLICVSHSLGQYMQSAGFSDEVLSVVPNGVPAVELPVERSAPVDQWNLGAVALFRPRKGMEILLESLALLRKRGLPVRLRAVGPFETSQYESEIHHLANQLGVEEAIDWVGFTRDVPSELAQVDAFVLPSLFGEGLPMVVLEAMASGLPVIGTRVEGVPEAITHGQEGLLAKPSDPADLAKQIGQLVEGKFDWQRMSKAARERHATTFSDEAMAAGVAQVYRDILAH